MTSNRHNETGPAKGSTDALLDAAREVVLAVGVRRTTLTDVARRAGLSRMTVYRHWPDVRSLVADLMTREWVEVAGRFAGDDPVTAAVGSVRALRGHPLWRKIVEVDPELLLPYLLDRRGSSHDAMLALVESAITRGRAAGTVRPGDARAQARAVLLTAQSFLLSGATMLDPAVPGGPAPAAPDAPDPDALDGPGPAAPDPVTEDALDAELTALLERYLSP
ncbi:TetR/AcrR family transcriptional regulator [Planomonospora parontospora]|uniref:TetR/AcrR family transcriptional regulator n=1 Tax=Planomonospora parontospora TaxID=58119 RepID=UPI00194592AC|nr:TetR/AcrR family transcriptional regulator [Planomonospora parontospora]GGL26097.1 TetR family transcriptional regulator [Planomonospora parontospora subsp. antibiotica]GII16065.1 TetR family transcriptional regulator [Planomonospora parontospora subsp. antibiotica]